MRIIMLIGSIFFVLKSLYSFNSEISSHLTREKKIYINSIQHWKVPIRDKRVIEALWKVPREFFVPPRFLHLTYKPTVIPIGYGQTLTDMYFVALMTQELEVKEGDKCLEIGTGSGYQASILSQITKNTVYSIEIVKPLAIKAIKRVKELGYNVKIRIGDGYFGWKEEAPFDRIIITCAIDHIPPPLIQQLKPGGIMIIPLGNPFARQRLLKVRKTLSGRIKTEDILKYRTVKFVPFVGEALKKR